MKVSRLKQFTLATTMALSLAVVSQVVTAKETIKVGVLHSLSGTMAISETTLKDTVLMLIDEQNKKGGLLGKKLEAVVVDPELLQLIQRSIGLSKLTDGAFDISYASMDRIWQFDGSMTQMPAPDIISASVAKVGYGKIDINVTQRSVYLKEAGMKIGFGAIG